MAILSAALFGVSPVLCKMLIGGMSPALLAGLLYLGSGAGLLLFLILRRVNHIRDAARLSPKDRWKLAGAVLSGGVAAPLCLTYGIKYGTATGTSLLLNLETAATTLISWLIFKEHIGARVWYGKFLILAGAALIILRSGEEPYLSLPGLLIVLACIFWGVDNNLTREVEDLPATLLAALKGLGAGLFNTSLALFFNTGKPSWMQVGGALAVGAMSYGLSLVLFVEALRRIGSARTSTFFAVGPFIGSCLSVAMLGERPPPSFGLAALLMAGGVIVLYREKHRHLHTHEEITHNHAHIHDAHHTHPHESADTGKQHTHTHVHEAVTHIHGHWPDIHHRHGHDHSSLNT